MLIWIEQLGMWLILMACRLVDVICGIFKAIAGITDVTSGDNTDTLFNLVFEDNTILKVFWWIFIIAIGIGLICMIVAIVKNMIQNNRQTSTIVGKFLLGLVGTLLMLLVVVIGIQIANAILELIAQIFDVSLSGSIAANLFSSCVGTWTKNHTAADFSVDMSVAEVCGDYDKAWFWPTEWTYNGLIDPDDFYWLPMIVGLFAMVYALIMAVLNLAKRLYEIVFCYLTMPIALGTMTLDDGTRFKNWSQTMITKVLLAYGAIFSVNIFVLLMNIVSKISMSISDAGWVNALSGAVFKVILICGGAIAVMDGQALFAKIFAYGDDPQPGLTMMRTMGMATHAVTHGLSSGFNVAKGVVGGVVGGVAAGATLANNTFGITAKGAAEKHKRRTEKGQNRDLYRSGGHKAIVGSEGGRKGLTLSQREAKYAEKKGNSLGERSGYNVGGASGNTTANNYKGDFIPSEYGYVKGDVKTSADGRNNVQEWAPKGTVNQTGITRSKSPRAGSSVGVSDSNAGDSNASYNISINNSAQGTAQPDEQPSYADMVTAGKSYISALNKTGEDGHTEAADITRGRVSQNVYENTKLMYGNKGNNSKQYETIAKNEPATKQHYANLGLDYDKTVADGTAVYKYAETLSPDDKKKFFNDIGMYNYEDRKKSSAAAGTTVAGNSGNSNAHIEASHETLEANSGGTDRDVRS